VTLRIATTDPDERDRGLSAAVAALRRGQLVGLPLDTAYGVAVDPFDERGVDALRAAKGRADLTIPVMVPRIPTVSGIARVDPVARALMQGFWPGPLTLVLPAQPTLAWSLADGTGRIAVRMPLHPVALELLARTGPLGIVAAAPTPAAATAPDGTGPPAATTPDGAFAGGLAERLAVLLDAGTLPGGPASAVVDLTGPAPLLIRPGPVDVAALVATCPTLVVPPGRAQPPAP
jgi:tRNA threonylcarbamoyl adenosine modification protein (Sua5/YciO/YrdC/YwlC family)